MNLDLAQIDFAKLEAAATVAIAFAAAALTFFIARRREPFTIRHPERWVALAAVTAFLIYGVLAAMKLRAFNMGADDLGRIDQAIWSVLDGRLLVFSASEIGRPMSRLAGHVELLFVALAPLFWIWDSATPLLFAQAAFVALGAWPAYRLGARIDQPMTGLAVALAYLAHPAVGNAALADIHGDTLAMPLILLALERTIAGKRWTGFLVMAVAVSAKEYVALLAITGGLYWLFTRKDRRLAGAWIALGVVWLTLVVPAFHHRYRPSDFPNLTPIYYSKLGATPAEVVKTGLRRPDLVVREIATPRKIGVMALLVAPFAFTPLLAPGALAAAAPVFIPLAVTAQLNLRNHHNATLIPFLVLASIYGLRRLRHPAGGLALLAATAVVHVAIAPTPLSIRSWTEGRWDYLGNPHVIGRTAHDAVLEEALALVPPDARVTSSGHLVPHLTHRPVSFRFPAPVTYDDIDMILVDLLDGYPPAYRPRSNEIAALAKLVDDPGFGLEMARDGVFVLSRRSASGELQWRAPANISQSVLASSASAVIGPFTVTTDSDGRRTWRANRTIETPLLVLSGDRRDIVLAASAPLAPVPWPEGHVVTEWQTLASSEIVLLALVEGQPAIDVTAPRQPWLQDPALGSGTLPLVGNN